MATIADVYRYRDQDITLMTDEPENRNTNLWPSAKNIVSFFLQGYLGSHTLHADNPKLQLGTIDNFVRGASRGDVFVFYCAVLLLRYPSVPRSPCFLRHGPLW
jgi:hypothetical protein